MHRRLASLFTCTLTSATIFSASALAAQLPGAGPPQYKVQEVGSSAWGVTTPQDINNRGVIVGSWDSGTTFGDPRHAVVWVDGKMIDLTRDPAIVFATAMGINDSGTVTGRFVTDGTFISGGFRWQRGLFEVLPTFAVGHQSGVGVSESGLILGWAMHEHFKTNATAWRPDLSDHDLGSLGVVGGVAYDANGWDIIVGNSGLNASQNNAFVWRHGVMQDIGALPGYPGARASAINNYNEVVGYSGTLLDDHAFYWSPKTGMIDLGNLGFPFGASANDINDAGVVVGYTFASSGRVGGVWHDSVPYDLNTLLKNGKGWELNDAFGINELGQIVGIGKHNGKGVAYLLTPVDTPMTTIIGPTPALADAVNRIEVVEAAPDAEVRVFYGTARGTTLIADCPGIEIDIANAQSVVIHADKVGRGIAKIRIPASARGERILFQAVDITTCDTTNLIVRMMD